MDNLKIIIYFMKMKDRRISNKFNQLEKLIFYFTSLENLTRLNICVF